MANPKKKPWEHEYRTNPDGSPLFHVATCLAIRAYIAHKTGIPKKDIEVHKTDRYLVVHVLLDGQLKVVKIPAHSSIYTIDEEDFKPLWDAIEPATVSSEIDK